MFKSFLMISLVKADQPLSILFIGQISNKYLIGQFHMNNQRPHPASRQSIKTDWHWFNSSTILFFYVPKIVMSSAQLSLNLYFVKIIYNNSYIFWYVQECEYELWQFTGVWFLQKYIVLRSVTFWSNIILFRFTLIFNYLIITVLE